jgi:hypothetical protein
VILRCIPTPVERIWGSLPGPGGMPVGEIWWLAGTMKCDTALADLQDGSEAGTVSSLASAGRLPRRGAYPLVVKTLHTSQRLSIQVHPGACGEADCKAETWIFLSAGGPDPVLAGLAPGCLPEDFLGSPPPERLESLLVHWRVDAGDSLHLPPGTVHALGGGYEVLEIQTCCDITYRLDDWGRLDPDGRPRELHVERAMACIDRGGSGPRPGRAGSDPDTAGAGYRITRAGRGILEMPAGSVLFLTGGTAAGGAVSAPACLLACDGGGRLAIDGEGYLTVLEEHA